jgi:hypothetical protein
MQQALQAEERASVAERHSSDFPERKQRSVAIAVQQPPLALAQELALSV